MTEDFIQKIQGQAAFLRYRVCGLEQRPGSDWDLAVRDLDVAKKVAEECFGEPLLDVERQYVEQRFYSWGQLDFLPVFEWDGWEYLNIDRFWERVSISGDGVPRPCLAHDAFIAWMCGLLHGGVYKERYTPLVFAAHEEDREELEWCLNDAFGKHWAKLLLNLAEEKQPEKAVEWMKNLRGAVRVQGFRKYGVCAVGPVLGHWLREAKLHLRPPFPWIAFLGPDGSGKSTVIEGLKAKLKDSRIGLQHVHWRPTVREPLLAEPGPPVTDPHGRPARGVVLSIAALCLLLIRWWIGLAVRIWHLRAKRSVMLSDRYFLDLLVDQKRYRYGAPVWIARVAFKLLPKPDFTMILLADSETILARKAEVEEEELRRQLVEYRRLAEQLGDQAEVIDVSESEEEVIGKVFEKVEDAFKLYRKR